MVILKEVISARSEGLGSKQQRISVDRGHPWMEPSPSAGAEQGTPNLALASKGTWGWEHTAPTCYRRPFLGP